MKIKQIKFFAGLQVNSGRSQSSDHEWDPDNKLNSVLKKMPAENVTDIRIIYEGFDHVNKHDWYSAYIIYEQDSKDK